MAHPTTTPGSSACDGQVTVPRFRAIYLMPWIIVTVLVLTAKIALDQTFGQIDAKVGHWVTIAFHVVSAAIFGATLTAAGILIRYSASKIFNTFQPGHWLIINSAVVGLLWFLFDPFWRFAGNDMDWFMASSSILGLTSTAIYWFAAMRLSAAMGRWKIAFWIFGIAHLLAAAISPVFSLLRHENLGFLYPLAVVVLLAAGISTIAALCSFLSAVVNDLRSKRRHDWLHWLGIAAVTASALSSVAWKIIRHFSL